MTPDAYDDCSAEDFIPSAPPPGTPSPAAGLLAATEDLFILDTRDFDVATLQPSRIDWCEEEGSVTVRTAIWILALGCAIAIMALALMCLSLRW